MINDVCVAILHPIGCAKICKKLLAADGKDRAETKNFGVMYCADVCKNPAVVDLEIL